uniref:CSON003990 protein n=1 Tax=Culicoides sonorensis TaxID=179676 RepID=A0A336N0P9_CULSO
MEVCNVKINIHHNCEEPATSTRTTTIITNCSNIKCYKLNNNIIDYTRHTIFEVYAIHFGAIFDGFR